MSLFLIIAILSFVQSLFGVGLLVFGTPILLLLGYSFAHSLSILLPCSLVVSLAQTVQGWKTQMRMHWQIPVFVLPGVGIGLFLALKNDQNVSLKIFVGSMLVLTAIVRLFPRLLARMRKDIHQLSTALFVIIGFVHGLTNMGGGLLTVTVSSLFEEKEEIRTTIAYGYLLMAAVQLITMVILGKFHYDATAAVLPVASFSIYYLFGNRVFHRTRNEFYGVLLTILMFSFGGMLLFSK